MPSYLKLLVFWVLLFGAISLLFVFRRSRIVQSVTTWHGPEPKVGETLGQYYWRRCVWVLQLLGQAVAFFFAFGLLIRWQPTLQGSPLMTFAMVLPVVAFLLLTSAGWYAFAAAKARWFGPNPIFEEPDHVVEA